MQSDTDDFLDGFRSGFKAFGHNIAVIVNTMLLLIVYIIGVGATAAAARISRKRFIETRIDKKRKSYWTALDLKGEPIERYYRQF